jgi:hypothetical protein
MAFIYAHTDRTNLINQIQALMDIGQDSEDKKKEVDQKALRKIQKMYHTSHNFEIYKGCVITNYHFYFEIMDPVGNIMDDLYHSMDEAKEYVDKVEPYLPKPKVSRSKVHNIRFVR